MTTQLPAVAFICTENSNRSQMAEGFARAHGSGVIDAYSAGSRPSGVINPKAIAAMRERGIDLSSRESKAIGDLPPVHWALIVTMGCGDSCPNLPADNREDWDLPDPKNMDPEEFNKVRDDIEHRVLNLIRQVKESSK